MCACVRLLAGCWLLLCQTNQGGALIHTHTFNHTHTLTPPPPNTPTPQKPVAGVMGAKRTSELVPFCHPLALDDCQVRSVCRYMMKRRGRREAWERGACWLVLCLCHPSWGHRFTHAPHQQHLVDNQD